MNTAPGRKNNSNVFLEINLILFAPILIRALPGRSRQQVNKRRILFASHPNPQNLPEVLFALETGVKTTYVCSLRYLHKLFSDSFCYP